MRTAVSMGRGGIEPGAWACSAEGSPSVAPTKSAERREKMVFLSLIAFCGLGE